MHVEGCGDCVHMMVYRTLRGLLAGGMNVRFVVVQVRVRWETERFVWSLSDSCQDALPQVDTYV